MSIVSWSRCYPEMKTYKLDTSDKSFQLETNIKDAYYDNIR